MRFSSTNCWPTLRCALRGFSFSIVRVVTVCYTIALLSSPTLAQPGFDDELATEFREFALPFLEQHCSDCHWGEGAEAAVDLSGIQSIDSLRSNVSLWDQIRGLVRIGAMPPADHAVVEDSEREAFDQLVYDIIHRSDCGVPSTPSSVTVRRLNSFEYDNTVSDLFGISLQPSKTVGFASDGVGNGFDNQGEVLTLSPLMFEKYMQAAESISTQVIVADRESLRTRSIPTQAIEVGEKCSTELDLAAGHYRVQARMRFGGRAVVRLSFLCDGEEIEEWEIDRSTETHKFELQLDEGKHDFQFSLNTLDTAKNENPPNGTVRFEVVQIEGPFDAKGKKLPPRLPEHHRALVTQRPSEGESFRASATEVFESFMRRAFRRSVERTEISEILAHIDAAEKGGLSYEEALQIGLQAVLVSPQFLFRIETPRNLPDDTNKEADDHAEGTAQSHAQLGGFELSGFELASRLSYFLWASCPDDELLDLADAGKLQDREVLLAQVDRMLNDPRSDRMVSSFFGQWLGLRNLEAPLASSDIQPELNARLIAGMQKETELVCKEIMHNGQIRDFLDCDFTFVNPRLADHYGIQFRDQDTAELYRLGPGLPRVRRRGDRSGEFLHEDEWERVALPANRAGILTHASILTLTSNPTRTSPVKRGKWVLDNILGDPPPPAPPGVPALEELGNDQHKLSLRAQLEIHRDNPSCASCHRVMDPIGLGLENFGPLGKYRTHDGEQPIDAQGELAGGKPFSGPVELIQALANDEPKFARHFVRQLMTYAIGRGLNRHDSCILDDIAQQAESHQFTVRKMIQQIATSELFLFCNYGDSQ